MSEGRVNMRVCVSGKYITTEVFDPEAVCWEQRERERERKKETRCHAILGADPAEAR